MFFNTDELREDQGSPADLQPGYRKHSKTTQGVCLESKGEAAVLETVSSTCVLILLLGQ